MASGCISPVWVMVGGPHSLEEEQIHVDLPHGWYKIARSDQGLLITRDGVGLQRIAILKSTLEEINEDVTKKLTSNMLPHELAEWMMDRFLTDLELTNQKLIERTTATIGGHQGYKLRIQISDQYGTQGQLTYKGVE